MGWSAFVLLFPPCVNSRLCEAFLPKRTGGGGGRTHRLVAFVIRPLTTHTFRDGPPFLVLNRNLLQLGAHKVVSIYYMKTFCFSYPPPVERSGGCISASYIYSVVPISVCHLQSTFGSMYVTPRIPRTLWNPFRTDVSFLGQTAWNLGQGSGKKKTKYQVPGIKEGSFKPNPWGAGASVI